MICGFLKNVLFFLNILILVVEFSVRWTAKNFLHKTLLRQNRWVVKTKKMGNNYNWLNFQMKRRSRKKLRYFFVLYTVNLYYAYRKKENLSHTNLELYVNYLTANYIIMFIMVYIKKLLFFLQKKYNNLKQCELYSFSQSTPIFHFY